MNNGNNPINPINKLDAVLEWGVGLTKREYFAVMAMQGFASNQAWSAGLTTDDWDEFKQRLAESAIEIADELLTQLETTKDK